MAPPFEVPAGVRFTCSRCGDCCRGFEILLGPGEAEGLAALDWRGRDETLVDTETTLAARGAGLAGRRQLRRRDDGACAYLGDDHQCRIHQHFGGDAKPLMCRLYPFGFYPLGDRLAVDVSFACRAVSEERGEKLDAQIPEWTRWLAEGSLDAGSATRHRLDRRRVLSAELLWELEHFLLDFLERRDRPLFERIRSMLQFVRVATTGDPMAPTAARLRQAMAVGIPPQMARQTSTATLDRTQRAVFYQWLYLALNPVTDDPSLGTAAERKASAQRHERAGRGYLRRRGQPQVGGQELETTFEAIARSAPGILAADSGAELPRSDEGLTTWLRAKIVGQGFLVAGAETLPFIEAVRKLLVAYPMMLWTTKALATHRGAPAPEATDLRAALRRIDRTLGRIPVSRLPRKQAKVFDLILLETDLVEAATNDILAGR